MVSNELKQLLNGQLAYPREHAPEPLLLPRITSRIRVDGLHLCANAAAKLSDYRSVPYAWPALADATAGAIAARHAELTNSQLLKICDKLPQLSTALIGLDQEASLRANSIFGIDGANAARAGLADATVFLRGVVHDVFAVTDPPRLAEDLMALISDQIDSVSPESRLSILAYFLPLAPVAHHRQLIQRIVSNFGACPGWVAAAAASRMAGLLDPAELETACASLANSDYPWGDHACALLAGNPAGSAWLEVSRALPYDKRLGSLLAKESGAVPLYDFVYEIMNTWSNAPHGNAGTHDAVFLGINDDEEDQELPEATPEPATKRRLQAQVFADLDGDPLEVTQGFMKGAKHDILMWIGPKSKSGIASNTGIIEPEPDEEEQQRGSMEITITMVYDSTSQVRTIKLPVDRKKRSAATKLSLQDDGNTPFISADVWLQHKGRIFQYLKLGGLTLGEPNDTDIGITLHVETLIRGIPDDTTGSDFDLAMVKKDNKYIVFGPRGAEKTEVSLQGTDKVVRDMNETLFNATTMLVRSSPDSGGTSWVGTEDELAMQLLRKMARFGNLLYKQLQSQGVLERMSDNIQFVNLDETDIVPIEYVYDKGYPMDESRLCEGFRDAGDWNAIFAGGKCSCSNKPGTKTDTLCPLGFWSLSKVIERQPGHRALKNAAQPSTGSPGITFTQRAMLATAPNVRGLDVSLIKSFLEETYPNRHSLALNWNEWETEIDEESPSLLILLPHHGKPKDGHTDFLEIGRTGDEQGDKLYAGLVDKAHVTHRPHEPGPVVLLLGCQTAQSSLLPFHTFAREFLASNASLVIATQASVFGRHAAPVANELVRQLLASTHSDRSIGEILRDVRQKMFTGGYLMSLALVSFGHSDWKINLRKSGEVHVSD